MCGLGADSTRGSTARATGGLVSVSGLLEPLLPSGHRSRLGGGNMMRWWGVATAVE
jgi:hypothetical protein